MSTIEKVEVFEKIVKIVKIIEMNMKQMKKTAILMNQNTVSIATSLMQSHQANAVLTKRRAASIVNVKDSKVKRLSTVSDLKNQSTKNI